MTPSPEPMCTHRPGALRREDAGRARGAHLDVAIMRPLMTIHTLHGCTFPLHEVNPEEWFESHRIINVRVMRRQVHPPDDEQTIYLQRDRRQSTRDQPCAANSSGASPATKQELYNSLLHFQTAFRQSTQTICVRSTPSVKRERVSLRGFLHHWKMSRPLLLQGIL